MLHLGAAMKDQAFVQYSSQRYGELIRKLEADEELHKGVPDHDLQDHIDVLEKKDLKSSGWLPCFFFMKLFMPRFQSSCGHT